MRATVLTVALAFGGVSACTGSPGATEPGSTSAAGQVCRHLGSVIWGRTARTRVVTDAAVLTVQSAGRHLSALGVAGLGPVSPRTLASTGPAPAMPSLMASLSAILPVSDVPGPEPEPVAAFDVASLRPGTYVTFTGADLVQARYSTTCLDGPTGRPVTGTVSAWFDRAVGIVQCGTAPPPTSTAAVAAKFCALALV